MICIDFYYRVFTEIISNALAIDLRHYPFNLLLIQYGELICQLFNETSIKSIVFIVRERVTLIPHIGWIKEHKVPCFRIFQYLAIILSQ